MVSTDVLAALIGAVVGALLGGIFQDLWALFRSRLRAAARALATLRRSHWDLARVSSQLKSADREMLSFANDWITLKLPPRVLTASAHVVEDLPPRLIEIIAECDDAAAAAEAAVAQILPVIQKAASALSFAAGSGGERFMVEALRSDLERASGVIHRGVSVLSEYHQGLSDLQELGD